MIASLMTQYLDGYTTKNVLDIGPGYSTFGLIAAQLTKATEVTFVDCDPSILNWQKENYRSHNISSLSVNGIVEIDMISGLKGPFGLVLCQEILEHLAGAEKILAAIVEQMEDGGRIIITVPTMISERWLKFINPTYMRDEPFGHVREFNKNGLLRLLDTSGLVPVALVSTQPHYFLAHTWLFGTRMQVEGSSGKVLTKGFRGHVFRLSLIFFRTFFRYTGPKFWGRIFPRNYFVIAQKGSRGSDI